jgi:hypothetical protein
MVVLFYSKEDEKYKTWIRCGGIVTHPDSAPDVNNGR